MSDALDQFFASIDWDQLKRLRGWIAARQAEDNEIIHFSLSARDSERYLLRLICDKYPDEPPSVKFINDKGDENDRGAWPKGNAALYEVVKLPPSCFLCTNLTREGFAHHSEWRGAATSWNPKKSTLLDVMNYLQRLLNSDNYKGRND